MDKQEKYTETLTITYESDNHQVDAKAVGSSLVAVDNLIRDIQKNTTKNEQLLIKARPFAQGSLELPIDLIVFGTAILFQDYPLLKIIREVISQYLDITIKLKGRPIHVENGNVIIIENNPIHVDKITLQCLDPGSNVSHKFSEAFQSIENDSEIQAVRVSSNKVQEPLIRIPRNEFLYFHPEIPIDEQNLGERYVESQANLIIRQPAFDAELAWRFIWNKTKIAAMIQDHDFLKNVRAGHESFVAGDSLDVDLKRLQEYDPAAQTYIDKQYTIICVRGHNRRNERKQGKLFE